MLLFNAFNEHQHALSNMHFILESWIISNATKYYDNTTRTKKNQTSNHNAITAISRRCEHLIRVLVHVSNENCDLMNSDDPIQDKQHTTSAGVFSVQIMFIIVRCLCVFSLYFYFCLPIRVCVCVRVCFTIDKSIVKRLMKINSRYMSWFKLQQLFAHTKTSKVGRIFWINWIFNDKSDNDVRSILHTLSKSMHSRS